jgi:uncharacterized protein YpuA (DUF1002 family)
MFNEIGSVVSFVLTQESSRIDRDIKIMSNVMGKMRTANKDIKDPIEVINKDISENTNNSDKGNQVIMVCAKKTYDWKRALDALGDDAQLANVDLQNILQKQQTLQMFSNISKMLYDTLQPVIRKMGG